MEILLLKIFAVKNMLVSVAVGLFGFDQEGLFVQIKALALPLETLTRLRLHKERVRVGLPLKLREVAATLLKFNVAVFLLLAVKVLVDLLGGHVADIAGQQVLWEVAKRGEVADPEALLNPVVLAVCEFVQH